MELTREERLAETRDGLTSLLEDAFIRVDRTDTDWLILVVDGGGALEMEVSYSLSVMVDTMVEYAETDEDRDAIRDLAATFAALAKSMTKTLKDMEGA